MVFKCEHFDVRLFNPESSFSTILKFLFLIFFLKDSKHISDILESHNIRNLMIKRSSIDYNQLKYTNT